MEAAVNRRAMPARIFDFDFPLKYCPALMRAAWLCRGKFRSKAWQALLEEAKQLVDSGVVELNLIAEDTNQCASLLLAAVMPDHPITMT